MSVGHDSLVEKVVITRDGYVNIEGKVLISPDNGWDDYVMREFNVAQEGHTDCHSHDFPHYVFVKKGNGTLKIDEAITEVREGSFAVIPSNALHQLINTGEGLFSFLCIVPQENHTFG